MNQILRENKIEQKQILRTYISMENVCMTSIHFDQ